MIFDTSDLIQLVHPSDLKELLYSLKNQGLVRYFRVGKKRTSVILTKSAEIADILKIEARMVENPRPIVKNKLTKT